MNGNHETLKVDIMAYTPIGPLFTDLYELTMAAGYFARSMSAEATFSLFVRDCAERNFFVAAGLEDVLRELSVLAFSKDDLAYLESTGLFGADFLSHLEGIRFTGEVRAMPEGSIFFPEEPILEVTASIIEAQIIETFLLNTVGFQTLIASKAARCVHAAAGRPLIDFSLRRTQGRDGGMKVARSSYLAGFSATSNVLAGRRYDLPVSGTMAHSFVQTFPDEEDAYAAFAEAFPDNSVFLIDTYDTVEGARLAARVGNAMKQHGASLKGVRLDSGDMIALSRQVRRVLDHAGLPGVQIYASSGFDEFKISETLAGGAPIDAFGVGTKMGVSADAPYMDIVYKLVRFNGRDVRKLSPGKATLSGRKQVFRRSDHHGRYQADTIGLADEHLEGHLPLLQTVMTGGKISDARPSLDHIRDRFRRNFSMLGDDYKSLDEKKVYPVRVSRALQAIQESQ
ncbi:Nicotinate phosphoribosyltransferase (EC [Olavius algarvensis associated proteobacterium Delta 3]|nr:Nicotinate phosphoribosyltransferase (EC [Olavius algarvensis associated proteobacterium Delta 3]CAB5154808.1 Nicotinate phosphoribosyltransferase (EC [Olavius algarvensis associated proteobacterium Delta 3]